jgi:hypothetical protein
MPHDDPLIGGLAHPELSQVSLAPCVENSAPPPTKVDS